MKKIVYFSSFDPISKKEIEFINKNKNELYLYILNGTVSVKHRLEMLRLVLNNSNLHIIVNNFVFDEEIKKFKYFYNVKLNKIDKIKKLSSAADMFELNSSKEMKLMNLNTEKTIIDYIINNDLYFVSEIRKYFKDSRWEHSISVANVAYNISRNNKLKNPEKYYLAGLLHDIGKNLDKNYELNIIEKFYSNYLKDESWEYHQFTAEYILSKIFPFLDASIIKAAKYHTTGCKNMSPLQMVIYSADKIEPLRGYNSNELIQACYKNYRKGFIKVLKENMFFLSNKKNIVNQNKLSNECCNKYLKHF